MIKIRYWNSFTTSSYDTLSCDTHYRILFLSTFTLASSCTIHKLLPQCGI